MPNIKFKSNTERQKVLKLAAKLCLAVVAKEFCSSGLSPENCNLSQDDYEHFEEIFENLYDELSKDLGTAATTAGNIKIAKQFYER